MVPCFVNSMDGFTSIDSKVEVEEYRPDFLDNFTPGIDVPVIVEEVNGKKYARVDKNNLKGLLIPVYASIAANKALGCY